MDLFFALLVLLGSDAWMDWGTHDTSQIVAIDGPSVADDGAGVPPKP